MYDAKLRLANLLQKSVANGPEHYYNDVYKKTILEIGFGAGELLTNLFEQANVCYGVDASKLAILELLQKNKKIPAILLDVSLDKLPFQDGHFDYAYMYSTVEYLQNPLFALMELKRVLKNDGILIINYSVDLPTYTFPGMFTYENMRKFLNNLYFKVIDEHRDGNFIYQKCENKKVNRMELMDLINNRIELPDLYDDVQTPLTLAI